MSNLIKSTVIGAVICGTCSATSLANDINLQIMVTPETSSQTSKWQEYSVVESFYQGDFQQFGRAREQSADTELMYKGVNSIRVPTIIEWSDV